MEEDNCVGTCEETKKLSPVEESLGYQQKQIEYLFDSIQRLREKLRSVLILTPEIGTEIGEKNKEGQNSELVTIINGKTHTISVAVLELKELCKNLEL